ncbi:retron St85 family effector protein [Nitrosomonas oligotropha]|uniref:Uncharacterized protein n=1 Tax=Nitrosomonas oligotropha TaxID=42354 RepID=A0A1H8U8S7_9PROT|nr:retron St85 family effector protein [Nitrosomonas oligotropha]SDX42386.1 hypothetical protein SAMN05216300_13522 [Nitrosomonas oligotropha]SEO99058.1 hypothetical protein SAMN05216333_13122 [Nitrosomonas oligotropha]
MEDPRLNFFKSINLDDSRILHFPGIVFVCGGARNDIKIPPTYVRDHIVRSLWDLHRDIADKIIEAEDVEDWLKEGHYSNLIDFETDIAKLATLIVLFVESAGSIAELGAFSVIHDIASKLIVFIRENSYQQDSFIRLGPIQYLEDMETSVKVYPWTLLSPASNINPNHPPQNHISEFGPPDIESVKPLTIDICNDIVAAFKKNRQTAAFSKTQPGHIMLLIVDMVDIFLALKKGEIQEHLQDLGINLSTRVIMKYLYLLLKLELLEKKSYGDHYYIATVQIPYIKHSFVEKKPVHDRVRFKTILADYYRNHDRQRHNALTQYRSDKTLSNKGS